MTVKYNIKICFATMRGYYFNLVWSTWGYEKLLSNSEVVIDLGYDDSYKFNGNNFFILRL